MIKRLLDIAVAALGLVALSPVLVGASLAIFLRMGRPVFFRQVRPGYRCRPFTLFKFRTMLEAADANGRPLPDRDRLTSIGNLLRKTSIDEIPQLWNILRGEMSWSVRGLC